MENHDDSSADERDDDGPPSLMVIRRRMSRDFILRHEEARMRFEEAEAARNGGHWEWDDDGAPVIRDPASAEAMLAMEMPKVSETRELDCAVCLEDFVAGGKKLRTMPCSHSFHQSCIFDWLLLRRFCPICRFEMPPSPPATSGSWWLRKPLQLHLTEQVGSN